VIIGISFQARAIGECDPQASMGIGSRAVDRDAA